MAIESDVSDDLDRDEAYFDEASDRRRSFDAKLLQEPLTLLPSRPPLTLSESSTVKDAMQAMKRHHRGCVLITQDGTVRSPLVGIFTERRYARNVFLKGKHSPTTTVREVMETEVGYVTPERTVPECMALMTEKKFRHLPVMEGDDVVGMVSIGDLVESTISEQKFTIEQLELYIRS